MEKKTFEEVNEKYDLEIDKIVRAVSSLSKDNEKSKIAKKVLLQFPEGMKPYAQVICDKLREELKDTEFFVWMDTCFGACDVPSFKDIDLVVQFGHSKWHN